MGKNDETDKEWRAAWRPPRARLAHSGASERKRLAELEAVDDPRAAERIAACCAAFAAEPPPPPGLGKLVWALRIVRVALEEVNASEPPASDERVKRAHELGATIAQLSERARDEQDLLMLCNELGIDGFEGDSQPPTPAVDSTIYTLSSLCEELHSLINAKIHPVLKRSKIVKIGTSIARLGTPGYYSGTKRLIDELQGR